MLERLLQGRERVLREEEAPYFVASAGSEDDCCVTICAATGSEDFVDLWHATVRYEFRSMFH